MFRNIPRLHTEHSAATINMPRFVSHNNKQCQYNLEALQVVTYSCSQQASTQTFYNVFTTLLVLQEAPTPSSSLSPGQYCKINCNCYNTADIVTHNYLSRCTAADLHDYSCSSCNPDSIIVVYFYSVSKR